MAIAFDNAGAGGTFPFNVTIGSGSSRIIIVGLYTYGGASTGATCDGVAMTLLTTKATNGDSAGLMEFYYQLNPTSGTVSVTFTGVSSSFIGAIWASYSGVAQQAPEASATDASTTSPSTATVTTITDNAWAVSVANGYVSNNEPAASTGTTLRADMSTLGFGNDDVAIGDSNGGISPAGNYSMSWTTPGNGHITQVVAAIAPVAAAAPRRWILGRH